MPGHINAREPKINAKMPRSTVTHHLRAKKMAPFGTGSLVDTTLFLTLSAAGRKQPES
jgi:hypothetical protein